MIITGIAVGAAVIVFITALITGLQGNIIERTLGSQSHIRFLPPNEVNLRAPLPVGATALVFETPRAQRLRSIVNWQELQAALDADPALSAVSPLLSGPALARRGVARNSIVVMGIEPQRYLRIADIREDLVAGRFNVDAGNAVIGNELAADLGLAVGDKLRLDGGDGREALVQVSGIFNLGQRDLDERYVYLDLRQAQTLLNLPGGVTVIDATVPDLFEAERIAEQLGRRTGLKAESWMQSNGDLLNALRSQSLSTQMISIFVGISVAFGIASVLAVSVVQRTREIGILRAMGSQRGQIQRVFLLQGALLGCGGSLLGAAIGWSLVQVFNIAGPQLFYVPVDPMLVPAAVLLSTLTGLVAALAPARRAAHYDPAEAIRYV
ncbi:MAG TPA: FtsX-like permease family protein [Pseudomonadaceae bacterium]|nr:FtsX-like permease family protein [Pseudomonadaceae bacterium]